MQGRKFNHKKRLKLLDILFRRFVIEFHKFFKVNNPFSENALSLNKTQNQRKRFNLRQNKYRKHNKSCRQGNKKDSKFGLLGKDF